ncbi:MAG: DUF255 domain-containing protein [Gemmatimonadota bacterium]
MNRPSSPASLEGSVSPFLAHGATQPVAWMPWGDAAFARARSEDKPILLDIGAVWCHWCHVMDRESYEDADTAALINELYVPVKVDRDDRPDVDARYQRAVQALTGQGGWPLTAFLTPSGETYFGGTYFPPADAEGRPAFRRILEEMARVWREEPERAARAARTLAERVAPVPPDGAGAAPPRESFSAGVEAFAGIFDVRSGGFGGAPKFPNAGALLLLLDRHLDTGEAWMLRVVRETLEGMARGGIHDQLGGGFHRYSVDARWLVPHFEKMAYDNGPLLEAYARAFAATGDEPLKSVCEGILRYYRETAPDLLEAGGFPASQDADVGAADDGAYWTWSQSEVREAVDRNDLLLRVAVLRYGMDDEAAALHSDPSRRVLWRARSVDEVAGAVGLSAREAGRMLGHVELALRTTRAKRPAPFVDRTLYTGWVCLVASGFLAAARYADEARAGLEALRALGRVWTDGWSEGRGVAHRATSEPGGEPVELLEDQAYLLTSLLDAFELYGRARDFERAAATAKVILERFRDPATGAFLDRPPDPTDDTLSDPVYAVTDSPTPSPAAVAALGLLRLAALTGRDESEALRDAAAAALGAFTRVASRIPTAMASWLRAADWASAPISTLVVVAEEADADLWRAALRTPRPRTVVRRLRPQDAGDAPLPEAMRAMIDGTAPRAYLCVGRTCAPPVSASQDLVELMGTYRG